jgi:uncharacterized protein YqgV (UPF0045/DUF77 family)
MPKMRRQKPEEVPYELSRYVPEIKKIIEASNLKYVTRKVN